MDFDYWMNLHKSDPVKFEAERKKEIDALLATCEPKNKLKYTAMQARINYYRSRNNHYNSFVYINKMMWESYMELNRFYNDLK